MATLVAPEARRTAATGVPTWLFGLFFLSGISGLMFQVVWVRMLTRILGCTVYATSTVLAAFMAGLALGSFLIGRYIDRARRPLVWYAVLELGIGLTALLSLWLPDRLLPVYRLIYETAGEARAWLTAGQVGVAMLLLLVPTILMGATLPTLCAFGGQRRETFGQCVGVLYALNTLGAVVGVLASGFVLIGEVGETNTLLIGMVLNIVVALAALLLGRSSTEAADAEAPASADGTKELADGLPYADHIRRAVLVCFALSGFVALANEVVWSRMLVLYQGTSIYAFSAMLAVMLAGMGIGSFIAGKELHRWTDPLRQLGHLQLGLGIAGLASLYLFAHLGLYRPDLTLGVNLVSLVIAPIILVGPLGFLSGLSAGALGFRLDEGEHGPCDFGADQFLPGVRRVFLSSAFDLRGQTQVD